MSDKFNPGPPADVEEIFAKVLAQKHEELLGRSDSGNGAGAGSKSSTRVEQADPRINEAHGRVEAAMPVLNLIENVKQILGQPRLTDARETLADQETRRAALEPAAREDGPIASQPARLGRFEIIEQIGQGGYGIVFRAHDPQLGRDIALKVPRLDAALAPEAHKRFVREATAAATVDHPHIVAVFEAGSERGIVYIVTQLVVGENLATVLARGHRIGPREAAQLIANLADALEHAHQRGVLHRDLKPSNILIEQRPDGSFDAKSILNGRITDFGLAVLGDDEQDVTRTGAVVGTPAFMSPEQASGNQELLGPATDVYGLGSVLYFVLTGEPPFQGATPMETIDALRAKDPISPRKLAPTTPTDLEAICLKCLEKSPARRYGSAYELQADLLRFLEGRPVIARPVTPWQRAVRWSQRNPALAVAATAAAIFLAASLIATTVGWYSTTRALAGQRIANERAERRSYDLKIAFDQLFSSIERAPEIRIPGADPLRRRLLAAVHDYYRDAARDRPNDLQSLAPYIATINRIALLKSRLDDHEGALDDARTALRLARSATPNAVELQYATLRSRLTLAEVLGAGGRKAEFDAASTEAIQLARSLLDESDDKSVIEVARAYSILSNAALKFGDRTSASNLSHDALQLWETIDANELDDGTIREMLSAYFTSGSALGSSERWDECRRILEYALDRSEILLVQPGEVPPDFIIQVANAHRNLGSALKSDQHLSEPHFVRALELLHELLETHPLISEYPVQMVRLQYSWALTEFIAGRYESANRRLLENVKSVDTILERYPAEKENLLLSKAHSLTLLGYSHENLGNLVAAIDALEESRVIHQQLVELSNQSLHNRLHLQGVLGGIAAIQGKLGNFEMAIPLLTSSTEEIKEMLAMDPDNGECKRFLAGNLAALRNAYCEIRQWDKALATFHQSMEYEDEIPIEYWKGRRAAIHLQRGDLASASTDYDEFLASVAPVDPNELTEVARIAVRFLETIDAIKQTLDSADAAALEQLRDTAVQHAIQRLNEMHRNAAIEPVHWNRLFAQPAGEGEVLEVRQWRVENQK